MVLLPNGVLYASEGEKYNVCENTIVQDNKSNPSSLFKQHNDPNSINVAMYYLDRRFEKAIAKKNPIEAKLYFKKGLDMVSEKLGEDIQANSSNYDICKNVVSNSSISKLNYNIDNFAVDIDNSINTNKFNLNMDQLIGRFSQNSEDNNSFNSSKSIIENQENSRYNWQIKHTNSIWLKNSVNGKLIYDKVAACENKISEFIKKQNNINNAQNRINTKNKELIKNIEEVLSINKIDKYILNKKTKRSKNKK